MLQLLADEDFSGDVVRGLMLRQPALDIIRVQDVELAGKEDLEILAWAAVERRIALTHDRATMPASAYDRVAAGESMTGVFVMKDQFPIGRAIEELLLIDTCTDQAE